MSHGYFLGAVLAIIIAVLSGQLKLSECKDPGKADARLGLLASSLGVAPVPGASYDEQPDHIAEGGTPVGVQYQNGGLHGGNGQPTCHCVLKGECPSGGGRPLNQNIPIIGGGGDGHPGNPEGGGLTTGYGKPGATGGVNPAIDGAGVIDVRIVNRPPPGQCLPGQTYCCASGNEGVYPGPDNGPPPGEQGGNGYATCGSRQIINTPGYNTEYGQAKFGAYPWMAVILGKGNNYIGAGALISPYYVLTAAHKVKSWHQGSEMKVRFGEWNAQDDSEPYKNVESEVDFIDIHPQFNPDNLYNDVALVRLRQPIDVNAYPHIKSACLPTHGTNFVGQRCWVAGFGKDAFGGGKHSFIMREVDLPVVDGGECEHRLRGTRLGRQFELHKKSFLCAGGEEGKDACTGDGGSPLMCEYNGKWTVAGLVAWGIGCAEYGVPGVYVNVPNYVRWIENKIYST